MRFLRDFLLGFGAVGLVAYLFMVFGFMFFMIYAAIYGLYLAFSASIILGLIVLFLEPSPAVIGLVMIFFHKNLAQVVIEFLNK